MRGRWLAVVIMASTYLQMSTAMSISSILSGLEASFTVELRHLSGPLQALDAKQLASDPAGSSAQDPSCSPGFTRLNERPIIAIMSQEVPRLLQAALPDGQPRSSYISASYVKYIESAGARVVPVLINQPDEYYEMVFNSTNGLLLPGGTASLTDSGYARAGRKLYEMAKKAFDDRGDVYPIWGTCLGFELLAVVSSGDQQVLTGCDANTMLLPLEVAEGLDGSRFGSDVPDDVLSTLMRENVTLNAHHFCLTPEKFLGSGLDRSWRVLSTNRDKQGLEFISLMEARRYPFWASQYHPEKVAFEWTRAYAINHSRHAVRASTYHAEFFVQQTRRSCHEFEDRQLEEDHLIYSFVPTYTGTSATGSSFQQVYYF